MKRFVIISILAVLLILMAAPPSWAQLWPLPANQPNTIVVCSRCPDAKANKPTWPWSAPISAFTGRYLDSTYTNEYQQTFRTGRARGILPSFVTNPNRLYLQIGSAVGAYNMDSFFTRLENREPLWPSSQVPVSPSNMHDTGPELFLKWDEFFYAENTGSGWQTMTIDGQDRLGGIDVDDRGNVYLAYSIFGWGIVQDGMSTGGPLMRRRYSWLPTGVPGDIGSAGHIILVRSSSGDYYVVVSGGSQFQNVWKVTNPDAPQRQQNIPIANYLDSVRTSDRVAIRGIGAGPGVSIYSNDGLLAGAAPLLAYTPPAGASVKSVTTDGTNFYVINSDSSYQPSIITLFPLDASKLSYGQRSFRVPLGPNDIGMDPMIMRYGDGYIALVTNVLSIGVDLRLFRVNADQFIEVPLNQYFNRYYGNPSGGYVIPPSPFYYTVLPVKRGTKLYLVLANNSIGDVYQLQSNDDINVAVQGSSGNPNGNAPAPPTPQTVYYGDKVRLLASSVAAKSITWDFGNPQASTIVGADANSLPGATNQTADHQYSGLTSLTALVSPRATDANGTFGQASLTFDSPQVRIGVTDGTTSFKYFDTKYLTAQPNASAPAPLVVGDSFFDASDGDAEGHYARWTQDGVAVSKVPYPTALSSDYFLSAGTCGSHTLAFAAHYGPYDTTFTTRGGAAYDQPVSLPQFTYSVRPFSAAIAPAPTASATELVFHSISRASALTTALTLAEASAVPWHWDLVDTPASPSTPETVLVAGSASNGGSGTGLTSVADWHVPKTQFGGHGTRVRLTLGPATLAGACPGTISQAYSQQFNGPDPMPISATGCPQACSFSVSSLSQTDMVADRWHFAWKATNSSGSPVINGTDSPTFTPVLTQAGDYNITVTVSNDIGSQPVTYAQNPVHVNAPACPAMTSLTVFIVYSNAASTCVLANNSGCVANQAISFMPGAGYDFSCSNHTFVWDFGDSAQSTAQSTPHTYTNVGTYPVTLTITDTATQQSYAAHASITIGNGTPVNPGNGGGNCATMTSGNVSASYRNAAGTCPGTCGTNSTLSFFIQGSYDFTCGSFNYLWNFGDFVTSNLSSPSHSYTSAGTYNVSLTITNTATNTVYSTSTPVVITAGNPGNGGGNCAAMTSSNVSASYRNAAGTCPGTCGTNDTLSFFIQGGYDFTCGSFNYQWNFGDFVTSNLSSPSHSYTSAGTYNVSLTIVNTATNTVYSTSTPVVITAGTVVSHCPTMTPLNMWIVYSNAANTCVLANNAGCAVNQPINFAPQPNGYDFSCSTTNTFLWDFGDGFTSTQQMPAHLYTAPSPAGTPYHITLTIFNGTQTYIATASINLGGGNPAIPQPGVTVRVDQVSTGKYLFTPIVTGQTVPTSFIWDFGDGSGTTTPTAVPVTNPSTYKSRKDPYVVILTVKSAAPDVIVTVSVTVTTSRWRAVHH